MQLFGRGVGLVLIFAIFTLPAQNVIPGSFHDDFETDRGWLLFEEIVGGNSCYGEKIATVNRATVQAYSSHKSLELWANRAGSSKASHVIAYHRLGNAGRNGKWRYSVRTFSSGETPVYQTGPAATIQNIRQVSGGVFATHTAAVQYQASPWLPNQGAWTVWTEVAPGVAAWVPFGYQPLESDRWYTLAIDADYDSNRYLQFSVTGPGVNRSFDLTTYAIAAERNFNEEAFDLTVEGESLWNNCGSAGVYDYKSYFDDVDLSVSPIPSFESVVPSYATASHNSFSFVFKEHDSRRPIEVVNVLFSSYLDGRNACYLAYHRPSNTLYLVDDDGRALLTGRVLDATTGSIGNSSCTIAVKSSSAVLGGKELTLTLDVTFSPLSSGERIAFAAARDAEGGNSGWRVGGVWRAPVMPTAITAILQSAKDKSRNREVFSAVYRHRTSGAVFSNLQLMINSGLDGVGACWVGFDTVSQELYLVADDGHGLFPPAALGTAQTRENSQCRIHALTSSSTLRGTDRILNLDVEFKRTFLRHVIFANADAASSGDRIPWTRLGTWSSPYP